MQAHHSPGGKEASHSLQENYIYVDSSCMHCLVTQLDVSPMLRHTQGMEPERKCLEELDIRGPGLRKKVQLM